MACGGCFEDGDQYGELCGARIGTQQERSTIGGVGERVDFERTRSRLRSGRVESSRESRRDGSGKVEPR